MMNLADALDIHAVARPDHPAIVEDGAIITYAELRDRVRRLASLITARVPDETAIVGLCLADTARYVIALYALARAGRAILPMDLRWTETERANVAVHFGATLVLGEPGQPDVAGVPTLVWDDHLDSAIDRADPAIAFPKDGETPFVLSLSSGTTGRPKGPLIAHRHFFRRFMTHWINLGLNGRDRFVMATPLYFGGGRTFAMSVLFSGGTVIMKPPPCSPEELIRTIDTEQGTSLFLVPTQFRRLLELSDEALAPLKRLNLLFSSGAPLSSDERRAIRSRMCERFFEYYASTEGGGITLLGPADIDDHGESVGRPVFAVEVEVVDDEDRPLSAGTIGKLRYRGPGVATAYYRDPEASVEAFRHGWFYPGDLAEIDAAGFVTLKGRAKDMIIRGGINIYPADVEAALTAHPAVAEAAVVGWPSQEFGEEIAAFVRLAAPADEAALIAFAKERLARAKWPKAVFVVEDLPKNGAGKVLKRELVERLPKG
ncbi:long-chain fatty acid--CoA ligase [Phreatobacter aquaticus]|uniref:Long-chain fatty acid--CoA ligase n=2 Tax=Phreatobacter aquaticus TaxID=2570229 RepID=A0A4D7QGU4_9HYPH|nr:long-chain fatty acid--CoA ligase [Phreatobacter aquaticus]